MKLGCHRRQKYQHGNQKICTFVECDAKYRIIHKNNLQFQNLQALISYGKLDTPHSLGNLYSRKHCRLSNARFKQH